MTSQQLKNSILQMAVQGLLVPQDPNDEPASVLLQRIREEKQKLVKEGKIKKEKHSSVIFRGSDNLPYESRDNSTPVCIADLIPFEIPESWEWARLGEVLDVRDGTHDTPKYVSNGIPLVTSKNLCEGKIDFSTAKYISPEDSEQINLRSQVDYGDILFAMIGSIGNPVLYKGHERFSIKNMALFKGIPNGLFMNYVLEYLFYSQYAMKKEASGGVQSFVSLSYLRNYFIPIPPLAEQRRIVAKLEELLPLVEEYGKAESTLTTLNATFPDALKKSILQDAVQGKLVPQDPDDEPASVLLERIRREKKALDKTKKGKRNAAESRIVRRDNSYYELRDGVERCVDDLLPFEIPESWEWARLGEVFQVNPRNKLPDDMDVGFIPMTLIDEGYGNHHSFELKKWSSVKKGFTHFANNDVVIAKITPCFQNRKSAIVSNLPNGYGAGTTELHVLRANPGDICLKFYLYLFKTQNFIQEGVKAFSGTAGQQRISTEYLKNYLIPIPPLSEQRRIVAKLEELLKQVERLK